MLTIADGWRVALEPLSESRPARSTGRRAVVTMKLVWARNAQFAEPPERDLPSNGPAAFGELLSFLGSRGLFRSGARRRFTRGLWRSTYSVLTNIAV
jgi:hypothetical protein